MMLHTKESGIALEPTYCTVRLVLGAMFPGAKRPSREANYSPS